MSYHYTSTYWILNFIINGITKPIKVKKVMQTVFFSYSFSAFNSESDIKIISTSYKRKNDVKKINTKIKATLVAGALSVMSGSVFANSNGSALDYSVDYSLGIRVADVLPTYPRPYRKIKVGKPCQRLWSNTGDIESISILWEKAFKRAVDLINRTNTIPLEWVGKKCTGLDISIYGTEKAMFDNWDNPNNNDVNYVTFAEANTPTSTRVGNFIVLNKYVNNDFIRPWAYVPSMDKRYNTALHELLHTLGLSHSFTYDGQQVPGTESLMDNTLESSIVTKYLSNKIDMSPNDIKGLEYIYN
jgi:hypothetical protein